jgi:putative transposase
MTSVRAETHRATANSTAFPVLWQVDDIIAFADFPVPHWEQDLEHQPGPAALLLAGSVLVEAHHEWRVADKRNLCDQPWPYSAPEVPTTSPLRPPAAITA